MGGSQLVNDDVNSNPCCESPFLKVKPTKAPPDEPQKPFVFKKRFTGYFFHPSPPPFPLALALSWSQPPSGAAAEGCHTQLGRRDVTVPERHQHGDAEVRLHSALQQYCLLVEKDLKKKKKEQEEKYTLKLTVTLQLISEGFPPATYTLILTAAQEPVHLIHLITLH